MDETELFWCDSSGRIELHIKLGDAQSCSHPGDCEADVVALMGESYISRQLDEVDPADLRAELRDYGAWRDHELVDHGRNLPRLVWLACCDVAESPEDYV